MENDNQFFQKIHMTDECHVLLCGKMNKQNFCYWGTANPINDLIIVDPCSKSPQNLSQLKDNIRREIRNIDNELPPKVIHNIAVRMQNVIEL